MYPLNNIKYCSRCCVPETQEGVVFDELGICTGCNSSEDKMHINWQERRRKLNDIFENVKKKLRYKL